MKIWLLTHSEELKKLSGTGKIVKNILRDKCEILVWDRTKPNEQISELSPSNTILVYQHQNDTQQYNEEEFQRIENAIIIDGTWQQAKKIYNHSPYLKKFCHYEISGLQSNYKKRRNQKVGGLSTAEVAIHLIEQTQLKSELLNEFNNFNQ